ncbi:MAG: DoxX family protein [Muribaculaceae bacterium]|nr:DoxX family protein [Muribaculaceae bacterium]MDE6522231.1 DoxX family protein [Muribaculaceae bacterium]MDE6786323.1 DoxX family protein [Muribaculaceae bacterium]
MNRKKVLGLPKKIYVTTTGYSYTHLGRLFLRLFVGIMLMQFGIRQIGHASMLAETFPAVMGMTSEASLWTMICIEIGCSVFIMAGFLTRIMILPPFVAMIMAEYHLLHNVATNASYQLSWEQPGYLPIMFLGIYFFLILVGPGKISVDYFLSLHLLHSSDHSEDELEEV